MVHALISVSPGDLPGNNADNFVRLSGFFFPADGEEDELLRVQLKEGKGGGDVTGIITQ